jgi:hypothetical protein
MGNLMGHNSIITAFKSVENSSMIISSDDKNIIKVWNIMNNTCI